MGDLNDICKVTAFTLALQWTLITEVTSHPMHKSLTTLKGVDYTGHRHQDVKILGTMVKYHLPQRSTSLLTLPLLVTSLAEKEIGNTHGQSYWDEPCEITNNTYRFICRYRYV